jgi:hypothetical protein
LTFIPFAEDLFMCFQSVSKYLLTAGVLIASVSAAFCCGGPLPVKTPGTIEHAVLHDGQMAAITSTGHLVYLGGPFSKLKDLGTFERKLAPCVDFTAGRAHVGLQNRLYQVDLTTGNIVRTVLCQQTIQNLGAITADRAYVRNGNKISIVDFAAGKTVQTVDLGNHVRSIAHDPSAQRLYALTADSQCSSLAVLDLKEGKIIERMETSALRFTGDAREALTMHVTAGRAYVVWTFPGCCGGMNTNFGHFDLKTSKYQAVKAPAQMQPGVTMMSGPKGELLLSGKDGVFCYHPDGKTSGPVFAKGSGKLLGFCKHWAVIATGEWLEIGVGARIVARAK